MKTCFFNKIPVWAWVFLLAVGIRLAYLGLVVATAPSPQWWRAEDTVTYMAGASSILQGTFDSSGDGDSRYRFVRTPGYPLLIAGASALFASKPDGWPVVVLQIAQGGAWCVLVWYAATLLGAPFRVAVLAGVLAAVHPLQIRYTTTVLADVSAATAVMASFVLLVRSVRKTRFGELFAAGLVLGFATLTRPNQLMFLPVWIFAVHILAGTNRLKRVVILLVTTAILPAAWAVHVWSETGVLATSTIKSFLWYQQLGPSIASHGRIEEFPKWEAARGVRLSAPPGGSYWQEMVARREARLPRTVTERERVVWEQAQADSMICAHKDGILPHAIRSLASSFVYLPPPGQSITSRAVQIRIFVMAAIMGMVIWGACSLLLDASGGGGRLRALATIFGAFFLVTWLSMLIVGTGGQRHMLPAAPAVVIFLAAGMVDIVERITKYYGQLGRRK